VLCCTFVSRKVVAAGGHRAVACARHQAQVRKPRWLARVHSRENGIVQALGTCAQATGYAADFVSRAQFGIAWSSNGLRL